MILYLGTTNKNDIRNSYNIEIIILFKHDSLMLKFFDSKADIFIAIFIIFKVILFCFIIYKLFNPYAVTINDLSSKLFTRNIILLIIITSLIFVSISSFYFSRDAKIGYIISVVITIIFFYSLEIYLNRNKLEFIFSNIKNDSLNLEIKGDIVVPKNSNYFSTFQVIDFLRKNSTDENFELNFFPELLISSNGLNYKNQRIFPLSGKSRIKTVFNKEDGFFPIISTDEKGFNNPINYLKNNKKIDALAIGDSFTEGLSVKTGEDISSILRTLDLTVYNIGKSSNGPLIELAGLIEYGRPIKPKHVLWFYSNNDIIEIDREFTSPLLLRYLEENDFSQNLINKQELIDNSISQYLNSRQMHANQQKNSNTLFKEVIIDIFKLHRIRYTLLKNYYSVSKINNTESQNKIINVSSLDKIKIVLSKADKVVNEWNGLLYFIYLPPCDFYFKKNNEAAFKELDEIKELVENLNIRFIDIHKKCWVL